MSSAICTAVRPTLFPHLPSPAANSRAYQQLRPQIPGPGSRYSQKHTSLANEATLHTGGLQTPPAEVNMSTTYYPHNPTLSSTYNSHVTLARQPTSLAQASRAGSVLCDAPVSQVARSQTVQQEHQSEYQPQHPSHLTTNITSATSLSHNDTSRHSTRPSTPSSTATSVRSHLEGTVSRRDSTMVMHSLQLPSCISPKGGSLDDFASLVGRPGS